MKRHIPLLLLAAASTSFIMGLASPLLAVSSRMVVGLGRLEFPVVEFAETVTIPQTVQRLGQDGDTLLMLVVLTSCIVFPALKIAILSLEAFGYRSAFGNRIAEFLGRWSFLELLVLAVFLALLKVDKHLDAQSGPAVGWLIAGIVLSASAQALLRERGRRPTARLAGVLVLLVSLSSCSKPAHQHYIRLDNLGSVAVGSSIMWKGAEIGQVASIAPDRGKLKVTFTLYPDFATALHQGAIAEVPTYALPGLRGRITVIGGDDPTGMTLPSGSELPAVGVNAVTETLSTAKEYLNQTAAGLMKQLEEESADLKREIPKKTENAKNAVADSLEALAEKLRRTGRSQ